MSQTKAKKNGKILLDILLYVFLGICVIAVLLTLFSRKDEDGTANLFGYQMRVVTSNSMEKCDQTDVSTFDIKSIPLRSLIFIETVPKDAAEADAWYGALREGDVLTFRYVYTTQITITHRITKITEKPTGGYIIELAGDNKNADADQLYQTIDTSRTDSPNYVIGKVTGQARVLGFIISILQSTLGIIFIIIVPCFIIIILELLKIFGVLNAEKKQKAAEAAAAQEEELASLRRRLAELEARTAASNGDAEDTKK